MLAARAEVNEDVPSTGHVYGREAVGNSGTSEIYPIDVAPVISKWSAACFPQGSPSSERNLRDLLREAAKASRNDYDASSAVTWAKGYEFPPAFVTNDAECLAEVGFDFKAMVRKRLELLSSDRLSASRIEGLRADNPERRLMFDLVVGMKVFLPAGFVANGSLPRTPLRNKYVTVSTAVNKMFGEVVKQRLAFLIPLETALKCVPNLHLGKAHWTTKKGKPSGRPLGDLSGVDGTPLNTDETSDAASEYYGRIVHPTIDEIVRMVHDYWVEAKTKTPRSQWAHLRLWKMDLKGAYTLLSFRPEDVGLFGLLLTGDLVYFQLAGIFGWSGTPAAFQVVTRAISWELKHALKSSTLMYVDDIIGICFVKDLDSDLALTRNICTALLGSGAVADDKTEHGTRLDIIGYTVCLLTMRVLIARKNFLTALHGFISTDVEGRINLRTAQRQASWGTRYGKICRVMRPFCTALNRATWGRTDEHALFWIPTETVVAIQCWRAMLCLVRHRETEFTRTIASFAASTPTIVAEFDSSLSGAGLIWYHREHGTEVALGVSAVNLEFLAFGVDSSNQNLAEFIGAILAVIGQIVMGLSGRSLALRGDSMTALTWAITERPRGSIVCNASMVWTLLCVATDINVTEMTHIAGKDNSNCDRLSRREKDEPNTPVEQMANEMGIGTTTVLQLDSQETVMDILSMCDPRILLTSESDFIAFWQKTRSAIYNLLTLFPIPLTQQYNETEQAGVMSNPVLFTTPLPTHTHARTRPPFADYHQ